MSQHYQQAIADFDRALQLDLPPSMKVSVYIIRGEAYSQLKETEKAIADYSTAIALEPQRTGAYINRGRAYYQLRNYENATADLTKAIELDPKNLRAYTLRGFVYIDSGKYNEEYEKALNSAQKTLTINPKYGYVLRGSVRLEQKDYQNALVEYEQALAINKNFWQAYSGIGAVYYEMGDKKVAIEQWQKALSIEPNNANVKMTIATALYTNGESEKGLQMASEALKVERRLSDENYINKNFLGENLRADLQKILNHSRIQAILRQ